MVSEAEIEALVLGSRWVHQRADHALEEAARNVLAKIGAGRPPDLRDTMDDSGLLIGPGEPVAAGDAQLPKIRQAIRRERKLAISYRDQDGHRSEFQRTNGELKTGVPIGASCDPKIVKRIHSGPTDLWFGRAGRDTMLAQLGRH